MEVETATERVMKVIFLDILKLKVAWIKITFLNDAFQSYYDLFQVNWLLQT